MNGRPRMYFRKPASIIAPVSLSCKPSTSASGGWLQGSLVMGALCASKVMLWWETVPISAAGVVTGLTRADVAWLEERALRSLGPTPFLPPSQPWHQWIIRSPYLPVPFCEVEIITAACSPYRRVKQSLENGDVQSEKKGWAWSFLLPLSLLLAETPWLT